MGMPRSLRRRTERVLSRIRMTQFSPMMVATVATRTSTSLPSMLMVSWPSWGRRRSTMFMFAMILMRLTSPGPIAAGKLKDLFQRAVDAEANADDVVGGLDVHVRGAVAHRLGQDAVDDLDDGRVVRDDLRLRHASTSRLREPSTDSKAWTSCRRCRWRGSCCRSPSVCR